MPTAVLMGMGLAPRFVAHADEAPTKDTIKPGPCVTMSDTPSPSASAKDAKDGKNAKDGKGAKDSTSAKDGGKSKPGPTASPSPSPSAHSSASPTPTHSGGTLSNGGSAPASTPTTNSGGSGSSGGGLLDPILNPIGSILGGVTGTGGTATTTPKPTPKPTATQKPSPSPSPSHHHSSGGTSGTSHTTKDSATKDSKDSADAKKPADAKASEEPSPTASATLPPPDADGKIPYPCPVHEEVAGDDEQTPNVLANKPWTLLASRLDLHGLAYDGVVNVRTADGTTKQALKFRASGIDIKDLHQLVDGPLGVTMHITASKGSTSTIRGGEVTMYTEKLSGNLLGLVPITFTPQSPPPLTLPELFFTDVTVVQAGQFGGNLTVPGLHGYSTGP